MRSILIFTIITHLLPAAALGAPAKTSASGSGGLGRTLAICTTAIHRNTVQVRGDGNEVRITVTQLGKVIGNIAARRSVKGSVQASNLEVQYTGTNGFVNISCNSEPAGLIRVNGTTDYLACTSGPDVRAIEICNNRWSNGR